MTPREQRLWVVNVDTQEKAYIVQRMLKPQGERVVQVARDFECSHIRLDARKTLYLVGGQFTDPLYHHYSFVKLRQFRAPMHPTRFVTDSLIGQTLLALASIGALDRLPIPEIEFTRLPHGILLPLFMGSARWGITYEGRIKGLSSQMVKLAAGSFGQTEQWAAEQTHRALYEGVDNGW